MSETKKKLMTKQENPPYHNAQSSNIVQEFNDPNNDGIMEDPLIAPVESNKMVVKFDKKKQCRAKN